MLRPEIGHRGDSRGPDVVGERSTRLDGVGLFTLQLLDCAASRCPIRTELMVERVLVRDRHRDVEQQTRRGGELQFKLLVRLVRSEGGGHGEDCTPLKLRDERNSSLQKGSQLCFDSPSLGLVAAEFGSGAELPVKNAFLPTAEINGSITARTL